MMNQRQQNGALHSITYELFFFLLFWLKNSSFRLRYTHGEWYHLQLQFKFKSEKNTEHNICNCLIFFFF